MAYASTEVGPFEWSYSERDVILYNLSIGCRWHQQRYVYESSSQFAPLPTLAVIPPYHDVIPSVPLASVLPKYNPVNTPLRLVACQTSSGLCSTSCYVFR